MNNTDKNVRQVFIRVSRLSGDTVSHVGIFDPALRTVAPLLFSLVQLFPPHPLPCVNRYSILVYTYTVCKEVGVGTGFWASDR
jgi:hypothetical protein